MTERIVDAFVRELKKDERFSNVVFVRSYPAAEIPNPIEKFVAAVQMESSALAREFFPGSGREQPNGRIYDVELKVRLYAKSYEDASSLTKLGCEMQEAVQNVDIGALIRHTALSGIEYNISARTVFRDLKISLSVAEEDEA